MKKQTHKTGQKAAATRVAETQPHQAQAADSIDLRNRRFDEWLDAMPQGADPSIRVTAELGGYVGNIVEIAVYQKTSVRAVVSYIQRMVNQVACDLCCDLQNKHGEPIDGLFERKGGAQ